jgi:TetR/AcrR family transcriptional repressor of lmrAB and yxaGH operons
VSSESRSDMVRSAAALIGSRGVSATSFSDVLATSGAPRGSIYHHFPDGKRQLAQDAVHWTSGRVLAFQSGGDARTPTHVLERFIGMWRDVVIGSSGSAGCVVAGVAIDTASGPASDDADSGLLDVVRSTFRAWVNLLEEQLHDVGLSPARAATVAVTTLAAMEGALILCRAEGSVAPLDAVAGELLRMVASA